jgi:heme/copper-type cytochrome/quinol oxidase subunit 2
MSHYFSDVIPLVFWTAVAVCAVAQVCIIAGAVRAQPPTGGDRSLPRSSRAIEIGWTIVPAVGLALLLFFTHRALDRTAGAAPDTPAAQVAR